ncbi:MAG: HD domain-containing phosphohydrolase [Smithella sp.]|jgi:HD-GYP domain-containing protein (c-di-GMP phosphodiesterase class II)
MKQKSETKSGYRTYHDQIKHLIQIGVSLSGEKNINRLLEIIVEEARKLTNADAGTLYIMSDDETKLQFAIIQNNSLNIRMGGTGGVITWSDVNLINKDGKANKANVSAYVAISGKTVNIDDVYYVQGFNFEGTKQFDKKTGYRSKSMLVTPLRNYENDIIGVLQLLNALDPTTGEVINFSLESQEIILSLASQAAVALSNSHLIHDLESLFELFIKTIATTIDEKSPYTGGHIRHVAELTMAIADKINETQQGCFAAVKFSDDQMRELRMAAWLHDVGKITTPEYVIDKKTKLQTVHDRIHEVKTRLKLIKKDYLPATQSENKDLRADKTTRSANAEIKALDKEYQFLLEVNKGEEFLSDEKIARIKKIAQREWRMDGEIRPLLSEEEVYNLCVRRGTLNEDERNLINNHALVTHRILAGLPFPKKLRNVADYAVAHHENIDGSGYPFRLKGDEIPLQSRIIAIADVFEALTADRPYRKGKTLSEALRIMELMVKDRHIDKDLFEFFIKEKIYVNYAKRELMPQQIDI